MNGVNDVSSNIFRNSPYDVLKQALAAQLRRPAKEMEVLTQAQDWVIQLQHSPYWVDFLHLFHAYTLKELIGQDKIVRMRQNLYVHDPSAQDGSPQVNHLG
jgi:hypothetical protein